MIQMFDSLQSLPLSNACLVLLDEGVNQTTMQILGTCFVKIPTYTGTDLYFDNDTENYFIIRDVMSLYFPLIFIFDDCEEN